MDHIYAMYYLRSAITNYSPLFFRILQITAVSIGNMTDLVNQVTSYYNVYLDIYL